MNFYPWFLYLTIHAAAAAAAATVVIVVVVEVAAVTAAIARIDGFTVTMHALMCVFIELSSSEWKCITPQLTVASFVNHTNKLYSTQAQAKTPSIHARIMDKKNVWFLFSTRKKCVCFCSSWLFHFPMVSFDAVFFLLQNEKNFLSFQHMLSIVYCLPKLSHICLDNGLVAPQKINLWKVQELGFGFNATSK